MSKRLAIFAPNNPYTKTNILFKMIGLISGLKVTSQIRVCEISQGINFKVDLISDFPKPTRFPSVSVTFRDRQFFPQVPCFFGDSLIAKYRGIGKGTKKNPNICALMRLSKIEFAFGTMKNIADITAKYTARIK